MNKYLFFIPIIEQALKEQDTARALAKAFHKIQMAGPKQPNREGFSNFERFMDIVFTYRERLVDDYIRGFIVEIAANLFEGTEQEKQLVLEIISSDSQWTDDYEVLCNEEASKSQKQDFPVIQLICEDKCIAESQIKKIPEKLFFEEIIPGDYKIKLINTEWIIWEGILSEKELIWQALPVAAETEDIPMLPTSEENLLNNGEIILRTYAGPESGHIEIEFNDRSFSC